ncbi:hypothetical protein OG601_31745 [Streptomyces sp. NBC_01239]|uniref:NAD(P)-binding protein n=1 Tax=Streptomyces sp. NBC_01239 TaxID=2903792 RepID=UPI0022500B65|nr:hypothetical protein [Streptomyces sp. NBC_01239]MCX4815180.1 hypothetical protein [Streptomyces sp. NBC_01239]
MSELTSVPGGQAARAAGLRSDAERPVAEVDVLVIGAGATGIYQLYRARSEGFSSVLLEAGLGVGGLWYWNRSFEACFEAESSIRGRLFSAELGAGWEWPRGAGQPDIERYLNHVVDRHGLRRDIELGVRAASAVFDERSGTWSVVAGDGSAYRARFLVAATGVLPIPVDTVADARGGTGGTPIPDAVVRAGRRGRSATGHREVHDRLSRTRFSLGRAPALGVGGTGSVPVGARDEQGAEFVPGGAHACADGPLKRLGVRGRDGLKLTGYWADGPRTYLGVMTAGFPNFFFPGGPHGALDSPHCAGDQVDFVTGALRCARERACGVVEVGIAAQEEWTQLMCGGDFEPPRPECGGRSRPEAVPDGLCRQSPVLPGWYLQNRVAAAVHDECAELIFSEAGRA